MAFLPKNGRACFGQKVEHTFRTPDQVGEEQSALTYGSRTGASADGLFRPIDGRSQRNGRPPSTGSATPVVNRSNDAAATTASATSSGVARRPKAVNDACSSRHEASRDRTNSVSIRPGETDTTRMSGASARASDAVILSTAALDAQYITLLPMAVRAAIEDILTTSPS